MKDILPAEMAVRIYVTNLIRRTYSEFGFSSIETPAVEHIENLLSKQGGENEKLIFKILKRGEKLNIKEAVTEDAVTDSGLRYDLTLPLSRYYSNHANELPSPFKALQIGPVWRADRPQRGRFRQFTQCDIDILGDASSLAEIELILATTTVLARLDFHGFTIRINDRRILKAMAKKVGFAEEDYDKVFIILDKMDKIGRDGVREELEQAFSKEQADAYLSQFPDTADNGTDAGNTAPDTADKGSDAGNAASVNAGGTGSAQDTVSGENEFLSASPLPLIISTVEAVRSADFKIVFDPTLVRGMSYYTGPIFEISMDEYGGSVGGGGRYDEMIGKFTGQSTPAVGFSIGFERIIMLLLERGFTVPGENEKTAFLVEKGISGEQLSNVFKEAAEERKNGKAAGIFTMKKNKKFQKDQLAAEGFTDFREIFLRNG